MITKNILKKVLVALVLFFPVAYALSAPCDTKPGAPQLIQHNITASAATSVSYCELCGYGYVTIIVSNPYLGTGASSTDMISMTVVENLRSSGLTYDSSAPNPIRYSVNGGALVAGGAPGVSGVNNSVLTWTSAQIPPLNLLAPLPGISSFSTIAITFAVHRAPALSREALALPATNRQIQASLTYSTSPACIVNSTVNTTIDTLPLREPIPTLTKLGRNVDAAQGAGNYTQTVYGNNNDDIIWRIQISNAGLAAMQDVRFNDFMPTSNMLINYVCPTEAAASAIAAANGAGPGALGCILASSPVGGYIVNPPLGAATSRFVVNNPFGTPGNDAPDIVDVPASGLTQVWLVGKIRPTGSCTINSQSNTVSNLQWGCTAEPPAGGLTATSSGVTPAASAATLSTYVGSPTTAQLVVNRQLRGINLAQPVGSKGTMTITITNNTGGTIKNITLRDVLPLEYVVDPTFTPTVVPGGGYGNYPGRTDRINWINPAPNTYPLTSINPADPLSNTQPQFTLTSSTVHPNYPDQLNMLRRGETLTINFRVVLIKSSYYDRKADLDVHTESPVDGTDPNNQTTTLSNSLYVRYEDFCAVGPKNAPVYPYVDTFTAFPEDLDIDINGSVFILTNDPLQPVTLPVVLRNNGGHDARDYHVFVTLGGTMQVTSAPAGCTPIAVPGTPPQPAPWKIWTLPATIPDPSKYPAVYHCVPGGALPNPMGPGASATLNFQVVKVRSTDANYAARINADDLTFRADVVGEIMLSNVPPSAKGQPLWFPDPIARTDLQTDRANNYSLDGIRARVIGFNLSKSQLGTCTENNPPPGSPDNLVQIGEECTFHIDTGGWFGFQTPGFTYIAVQNITVTDQLPSGQGYISNNVPAPVPSSTPQINNITITPRNPLDEGWIDWTFNPVGNVANRITQKDEWFRANITNRILNSPLNVSAAPNQQAAISSNVLNSTFQAVFNNASTGLEEIFSLGPGTVGYPQAVARTVNLTVTEPNLTLVKTVCNETLYGTGQTCSNFVPLANNGDTYDNYIYRITVTNGASAGGVARAPAYDVVVTDVLDPSDLSYVLPFGSDGLDNDGDGLTDGADGNGEGTISDNTVNNGIVPTLTFSYTHSTALQKINPGASVNLYYRVDPDQRVQPGQSLVNTVSATYDSLAGPSGAQTVVASTSGTTGGARTYNTASTTATVQMLTPSTQPKKMVKMSNHAGTTFASGQGVSIGEEINYELHTLLPIANLRNFVITDNLPVGLRCTEALPINLSAAPYSSAGFVPGGTITPTCTDTQVRWDFGTQALTNGSGITLYDFAINFIGRIENTANTNNAGFIRNGGAYTVANAQYTNSSNAVVTLPYANVDVQVQEPTITLTKTFTPVTADAGDLVTVTVAATNNTAGRIATAYNLQVRDDLTSATYLSYAGGIVAITGAAPTAVTVGKITTFSWPAGNAIAFGETRTFSYKVLVDIGAQPLEVLSNNALNPMQAKWDSLPGSTTALNTSPGSIGADGSATGLRNGALPNAGSTLNDYETSTSATLTLPAVTLAKSDQNPSAVPAIGERKHFRVTINLPEATTQSLSLNDNLAFAGQSYVLENNVTYPITYTFSGIATINGVASVNGTTLASTGITSAPADGGTVNALWNIGAVVTNSENDNAVTAISPSITIDYYARINNVVGNVAGVNLRNAATASYFNVTTGASTSTATSSPAQVTIVEPSIALTKTVVAGTSAIAPNPAVQIYTLTMTAANGALNSEAFDVAIRETLGAGLTYLASSSSVTVNNGATWSGSLEPSVSGQVLSWNLANIQDIDIPKNGIVTLVFEATYTAGINLTSTSLVQWTSLNGANTDERDGSGAPGFGGPNYDNYYTSIVVNTPAYPDNTALTKSRLSDTYGAGDANVRIGDLVDYKLTVHLSQGTTLSSQLVDVLPRGLEFVSVVSVNTDTTPPYSSAGSFSYTDISAPVVTGNAATGTSTVTWTLGDITNSDATNSAASDFVIVYRAKILNGTALSQISSQSLTNTATFSYLKSSTATPDPTSNTAVTVQQPILGISKIATPPATRTNTTLQPGDIVQYTVDVTNTGSAPAYDVVLKDVIPYGMRNGASTVTMVSATINGTSILPFASGVFSYDIPTNTATWNFAAGTANQYAIPAAGTLRVVYSVTLNSGLPPGLSMVNAAQVSDYCSFDSDDVPLNGNVNWRKCYGATAIVTAPVSTTAPTALLKQNWPLTDINVAIGQSFTYRITIPATPQLTTLYDVHIRDDLSIATTGVDMSYVSIAPVSGPSWTPAVTVAANVLDIYGSNAGGLDIPANQQVVFDITVILNDNVVVNSAGKTFLNTASYTFDQVNDVVSPITGGSGASANRTIVGPNVTLQKTGPATMRLGVPGSFTLNVQNTGSSTAWDATIVDILPNSIPGGMCDVIPTAITARMYLADGVTTAGAVLVQGTDYSISTSNFGTASPTCTLTLTMQTAVAAIAPTNRLIISYQALLDADNLSGVTLTNIAGVTQWFSGDTPANVATGQIHTYSRTITNGTVGTLDHEDAHSVLTESPVLEFRKIVSNVTTGQNPGANARPGDVLRYTVTIKNVSTLAISNFSLTDELDRLNATAMFVPGSLSLISIPLGATATLSTGSKGTQIATIGNLNIDAQGGANDTLTIVFQATLASVITNGTAVLNQAQLPGIMSLPLNSDDPNVNGPDNPAIIGDEDPTRTVITSAPVFQVRKTSLDITADPLVLLAGERLRYTITVKNIGNENASNVMLRDPLPANTTYVPGSTRLNGNVVADVGAVSALQTGMLINAPENVTAGVMRADATPTTVSNIATITFEVQISSNALNGTIISNQGFVTGSGLGSGLFQEKPSDDPATTAVDDPTLNIVGNFPLLIAQKVVAIQTDNNTNGIVDPLDVLRYTITISNLASIPATGVTFTDLVPANTTYVADTVTLNGAPVGQPDGGVSPLILGIGVTSPTAGSVGVIAAHDSAVITFDVQVNAGVATGTVISNQGNVTSIELPNQPTDADGNSSNGYQPTTIIVGSAQQLSITKQVSVVGGGAALAGGQLEYLVRVTNTGTVAASNVVITDDLSLPPLSAQVSYVAGSGTLNGLPAGVGITGNIITANYAATYGNLSAGATAQLRFRVNIVAGLAMGTTITNTAQVAWNSPALTATASVAIDVGGVPGSAGLNGHVWYDANFNKAAEGTELNLAGWSVAVYRNNLLLGSTVTDANGLYAVTGLTPTTTVADQYSLQFSAPGAVATTAKLGRTDSVFTNGMQQIGAITALSGSNLQNLNLPINPNGVLYNSILRTPVTGAMLTMVRAGSAVPLPQTCFDDPVQQGQITLASGYYKFDLNFSDPACPSGGDFLIQTTSPLAFMPGQSLIIPPLTDGTTPTFSVPNCPTSVADAIPATASYCEAQPSEFAPAVAIAANTVGTNYYLKMAFNNTVVPGHSQIFDNHIAIDPRLDNAVSITKISALQNVTKGQLVPYTITVNNTLSVTLTSMSVVDTFPPGFKYVAGSGRLDGQPVEPVATTRTLTWGNLQLATNTKRVIQLMLIVGSGVKEGKYVNRAQVRNTITGGAGSPEASATVRVIPDPTLDCSDVIGKVFDDANLNGYQDEGEMGLAGVRVVSARGLIVTTDKYGRFHLTCAVVPDPDHGSNFILKVDDRSLPSGYRITTENPRVLRATRGKMLKFNFGAAIHKVVKLDMADGVFEPGTTEMRVQWKQRIDLLLEELKKAASVLRLSYLAETEREGLVNERLDVVKREVSKMWKAKKGNYDLTIETEVFWRTGAPPEKGVAGE
jgi:uncharacterized repeat protein (TIGR01451 family)/fimbrial isopeptide formation D2 family protein